MNISAITGTVREGDYPGSPSSHQSSHRKTKSSTQVSMNDNSNTKSRYLMTSEEIAEASKITPEMKMKLREDSAKVWDDLARNNVILKKTMKDNANKKMAEKKKHAEANMLKWGDSIKNSPFHTDFNLLQEKQEQYMKEKQAEMKLRKSQADAIRRMTGLPKNDIQDREIAANTIQDMKSKLALQYRATKLGHYTLLSEKEQMDQMVMNECEEIIRKFPIVGLRLAFESNSYIDDNNNNNDKIKSSSRSPSNNHSGTSYVFGFNTSISATSTSSTPSVADSFNVMQSALTSNTRVMKRRYNADEIKKMKEDRDNVLYRADGRYSVSGDFIETKNLKTSVGMTVVEV